MASWVQLTLDTHAPVVTFGAADSSGGALSVPYTINEPAIVSAWVVDAAGLRVDLEVQPTRLFAVLPANVTSGNATVFAHAVDAVGNARDYSLVVLLAGLAPSPEPPPPSQTGPGIRPARIAPRPRKFITSRSRLRGSCPAEVQRAAATTRSAAGTGSSATTRARVTASSPLAVSSSARAHATVRVADATSARAELSNVELRRRDGRGLEEALLLDLL